MFSICMQCLQMHEEKIRAQLQVRMRLQHALQHGALKVMSALLLSLLEPGGPWAAVRRLAGKWE